MQLLFSHYAEHCPAEPYYERGFFQIFQLLSDSRYHTHIVFLYIKQSFKYDFFTDYNETNLMQLLVSLQSTSLIVVLAQTFIAAL